jgi:hypothetical protein
MKRIISKFSPSTLAVLLILAIGCGAAGAKSGLDRIDEIMNQSSTKAKVFTPPLPDSPDFTNYNTAQRRYADKTSIIWCTTTWGNPSAPMVTIPIQSKLTSSSVSFYPGSRVKIGGGDFHDEYTPERRSVDGMYHGSPPPYRYGFTPGGQYVDFFNMPTLCTTALTKFQRKETKVSVDADPQAAVADAQAQAALKRGDKAGAQKILSDALGGG